jgi:hypothetical protein
MSALAILPYLKLPGRCDPLVPVCTLRCDQCRNGLGLRVHRYWHMRFCSPACMTAYKQRLNDETRVKIRRLEAIAECG